MMIIGLTNTSLADGLLAGFLVRSALRNIELEILNKIIQLLTITIRYPSDHLTSDLLQQCHKTITLKGMFTSTCQFI